MKKAIRYLRFSSIGQSHGSIETQEMYTQAWCDRNNVEILDTFVDAGYTARTFDRPDMNKLLAFIKQYHRSVDYLVVSEFDRFSRDAGESLSLIKKLQIQYSVQIVSVQEGITFDYRDNGSFFRAGLSVLLGEEDNIRRMNKINSGIYNAKAREGRYIHGHPPYGYRKEGEGKNRKLVIDAEEAEIVKYAYNAFLSNTPISYIESKIQAMGCKHYANSFVTKMLQNPVYCGQQYVKPWRELPGGIFPANHEPIIDLYTWNLVQEKFKGNSKTTRVSLSDEMPLRGVLHCHCGKLLTGAPSRNKNGKYFYYYKCQTSSVHNNISAIKAHRQLSEVLKYLSLPDRIVNAIKKKSAELLDQQLHTNKQIVKEKKKALVEVEKKLTSLEEKWLNNQITFDTYNRWHNQLINERVSISAQIDKLSGDLDQSYFILNNNIEKCTDLNYVYQLAALPEKQQLLNKVFDRKLYYFQGVYRTPWIMPLFAHNSLILKEKNLLDIQKKGDFMTKIASGGPEENRTPVQTYLP